MNTNNIKKTLIQASMLGAVVLASALPAFAQTSVGVSASVNVGLRSGDHASSTEKRMDTLQNRGDAMITSRIDGLNRLLTRIQSMTKISDTAKASLGATIQGEISALTTLKVQIDADTSTTTLKTDDQSITKAYRIYALVMPQISIIAAADRIGTIADMLTAISAKIQVRLSSDTTITGLAALQADLTDMNAKIADADTQAQAAMTESASLKPDNGDKTLMASNTAALKDARTKIQTGAKDLQAARKDAQTIIQALKKADGAMLNASSTTKVN